MSLLDPRGGAVALALLIATPCLAQTNLVTNGSFDTQVLGWEPVEPFMSVDFDIEDVDESELSGSALVAFNSTLGTEKTGHVGQCVAVLPGRTYPGSVSFLIPTGQDRLGSAALRVAWYGSDDCSGVVSEVGFGNQSGFEGAWADLAPLQFVAPAGTASADVQLEIRKPVLGGTLIIHFDEVMFLPEPSPLLAGLAALVGVIGVARWTRRRRCVGAWVP